MAKPLKYPTKKIVSFSDDMIRAIDDWRVKQRPLPNQNEAIRRLIEKGIEAEKLISEK